MKKGILFASIVLVIGVMIGIVGFLLYRRPANVETLPDVPGYVEETTGESIPYKVPESLHTEVIEETSNKDGLQYSDTSICAVFGDDIRNVVIDVFDEYLAPLQEAYKILNNEGYEYFTAFHTDMDTVVEGADYVEFTVNLPGARGRYTISKEGSKYMTTFRYLKDDEYPVAIEPDEEEVNEDVVGINYTRRRSANPAEFDGYSVVDDEDIADQYVVQSSDYIKDSVPSEVIGVIRERFDSDEALCDTIDFLITTTGQSEWKDMTVVDEDRRVILYEGDYMFVLSGRELTTTDIYVKNK